MAHGEGGINALIGLSDCGEEGVPEGSILDAVGEA